MYADIAICDQKPVHANGIFRNVGGRGTMSVLRRIGFLCYVWEMLGCICGVMREISGSIRVQTLKSDLRGEGCCCGCEGGDCLRVQCFCVWLT